MEPIELRTKLDAYAAAWNSDCAASRRRFIERACAHDVRFQDDAVRLQGRAALGAHIAAVRLAEPGSLFELTCDLVRLGRCATFCWGWTLAGGTVLRGLSLVEWDDSGRLVRITARLQPWRRPGASVWRVLGATRGSASAAW